MCIEDGPVQRKLLTLVANLDMSLNRFAGLFLVISACFVLPQTVLGQDSPQRSNSYLVKPGDTLVVSVWKEEDLLQEVIVRPDGGFSFPLAGDVMAAGRTVEMIRVELTRKLTRYIPDLVATVMVTGFDGNNIYVIGQVTNPGAFVMNPRVDVMQALSLAGGTTTFAELNDIKILRRRNGVQSVLEFRFNDVARGRNLEQNILLESGDVVVVP
jgi:polysaccharide export outer membrane protein